MITKAFDRLLTALVPALREAYGARLVSAAVYGSLGRGTPRADSDIDLLLIIEGLPRGRSARMDEFLTVEKALEPALRESRQTGLSTSLSPILKTPDEAAAGSPLFLDMIEDARFLYDREGFFRAILDAMKARLDKQGAIRIRTETSWIWDLKPGAILGERIEL